MILSFAALLSLLAAAPSLTVLIFFSPPTFFSTVLSAVFFVTAGFFLVKSDTLCKGVEAFGLASSGFTLDRDRHLPCPRSSRGRRICHSLSSFVSRRRSNALIAPSIACSRSSEVEYGKL